MLNTIQKTQFRLLVESFDDVMVEMMLAYFKTQAEHKVKTAWRFEELQTCYYQCQQVFLAMNKLDEKWRDRYTEFFGDPENNILARIEMEVSVWAPKDSG